MSSFTATCLSAAAICCSRERSTLLSNDSVRNAAHNEAAAPAFASARACANAPDAGSRGSSPVVNARAAIHASLRAERLNSSEPTVIAVLWTPRVLATQLVLSTPLVLTTPPALSTPLVLSRVHSPSRLTKQVSTPAFTNAPFEASHLKDALPTTFANAALVFQVLQLGQVSFVNAIGNFKLANVTLASSAVRIEPRTSRAVWSRSCDESSSEFLPPKPAHLVTNKCAPCTPPAPTHAAPHPGHGSCEVMESRNASAVVFTAAAAVLSGVETAVVVSQLLSTASTKALVNPITGCSPRPSGPA
mmetsp:Transcript_1798/g.6108  ORF Transcript_1798/g.6108 Transcript_1798/m.6108 type:complete len:303 (-) Transcript_1798:233-1141(-)